MSAKMLYRIHGEPERGVMAVELDGYKVEAKIFQRGEKPEGWVSAATLLEFLADELAGDDSSGADHAVDCPEVETVSDFDKMKDGLVGMDDKEAKLKVDEWAAARGIKLDRRKSLSVMLETLEKALADG